MKDEIQPFRLLKRVWCPDCSGKGFSKQIKAKNDEFFYEFCDKCGGFGSVLVPEAIEPEILERKPKLDGLEKAKQILSDIYNKGSNDEED
jgi:hypothetical protein